MLFDASGGSQQKSATGSLSNPVEALMVVCLFKQLEAVLQQSGQSVEGRCSVITPYREQRAMILRAFAALCGGEGAAARYGVRVSTIDG
jgi:senataxin